MAKNNQWKNLNGLVFSTDSDFKMEENQEETEAVDQSEQRLRVCLDRKQRRGKSVTLITGFDGTDDEIKALGKALKSYCGVGGTAKNGEILIQGDQRDKVVKYLLNKGYSQTKKSGG